MIDPPGTEPGSATDLGHRDHGVGDIARLGRAALLIGDDAQFAALMSEAQHRLDEVRTMDPEYP